MKSFTEFFLEYAHNYADGTPAQSIKAHNGKGGGIGVGLDAKIQHIVGPYQKKNIKLNVAGSILTYPELEEIGIKDAMNLKLPHVFKNVKNSEANVQVFRNPQGMVVGRVIKASPGKGK